MCDPGTDHGRQTADKYLGGVIILILTILLMAMAFNHENDVILYWFRFISIR